MEDGRVKFLVTGFEPFGDNAENASWEAVRRLHAALGELAAGDGTARAYVPEVAVTRIPVEFGGAADALMALVEREHPDVVLMVGEYGGRAAVTPELVAINHRNAHIADNAGACPREQRIAADGPDAYFATVPVYRMARAAAAAGVEAKVSTTAGTYCCNDVFYGVLHRAAMANMPLAVGFVHVPWTPDEAIAHGGDKPSMSPELATCALAAMVADLNANGLE